MNFTRRPQVHFHRGNRRTGLGKRPKRLDKFTGCHPFVVQKSPSRLRRCKTRRHLDRRSRPGDIGLRVVQLSLHQFPITPIKPSIAKLYGIDFPNLSVTMPRTLLNLRI
jgi:hypothetical protein